MKICIYGASGDELAQEYFDAAQSLGRLIAEGGHSLVFGGGSRGLMGACARGALSRGGEIVGVAPRFFDEPGILFPGCSRFVFTETMRERKAVMEDLADAFVVLPGGIGTFEEFLETLTLKQLGRHDKPIAVLNTLSYYADLLGCFGLFALCETPEEALRQVCAARPLSGSIRRLADYTKN